MLRGLWKLTWLETKIFVREPLGVVGTVGVPIVLFLLLGRIGGRGAPRLLTDDLPILVAVMIAMSAIISLVSIIAIYREGGILKRLRATPLQPTTILLAHVLVKLGFTALSLVVLGLLGMR
ncbi:MAG: ABC transporter permease, partial [Luteitalea sp.]